MQQTDEMARSAAGNLYKPQQGHFDVSCVEGFREADTGSEKVD